MLGGISMELEKDEKIVLDKGALGFRKKLTLTNKRLIVQEGKGLLSVKWKIAEEIPIREISEAYAEVGSFTAMSTLMLKLKNGATKEFHLKLNDSQMLGSFLSTDMGTDLPMRMKFVVDRWVTAINHLIK